MMEELTGCPFCGGILKIEKFMGISNFICDHCGAIFSFRGAEAREDAIRAANRRPAPENKALTCKGCMYFEDDIDPAPCRECKRLVRVNDYYFRRPEEVRNDK